MCANSGHFVLEQGGDHGFNFIYADDVAAATLAALAAPGPFATSTQYGPAATWATLECRTEFELSGEELFSSPNGHSKFARSHCPNSAAARYVLCRNSINVCSGSRAVRTTSYGKMNSPSSLLKKACTGRTDAVAKPSGAG